MSRLPARGDVGRVVDFYLYLSAAIVTLRILIRRTTPRYRWGISRPGPIESTDEDTFDALFAAR